MSLSYASIDFDGSVALSSLSTILSTSAESAKPTRLAISSVILVLPLRQGATAPGT
jgi:hypothetical protein